MTDLIVNSDGSIGVNKKKKKNTDLIVSNDGSILVNPTRTQANSISPIKTNKKEEDNNTWFKAGAFNDGYQFGDVFKTILGTTGDVAVGATKGIFNLAEGVVDLGRYGVAGTADLLGADNYAKNVKERAKQNTTNILFGGIEKAVDKNSVLGNKSDAIPQGLGYVAGLIATGGLAGAAGLGATGVTVATTGTTFSSAFGNGMSQAYDSGATDEEATKYGLIAGVAEAGTELMFGGLGKAVGATGLSKGFMALDDKLATKVSSVFKSTLSKNLAEYTVKASGEGIEEVASGLLQAIGQKMTYMSEEDLGKLVEDQNLLESFITGAVVSGIAQTPSLVKTTKAGRDFVTGYTQNEQSIIDKEVENRIKELETDDKKLTNREKAKIEEQVKNDLEKGYISTDTIESTFGGEEYNALKTTLDKKTAIENEIKELENKPYAELTVKENERLQAIREELKTVDINTLKSNLESSMASKIANDGYLQRSYQEKANRSAKYEADVTKYDAKQRATIQKAIDSGILNNTNKTHEFVDMVAKISADKGVSFDFANNTKLKESGFAVDGKQVNGFVNENGITVNIDSNNALNKIVGHEITHVLEGTELYTELQQAVKEYATTKGVYDTKLAELTELYKGVEGAKVENELTSELVGEYLFTDTDFVNNLSATKPNVFQKIYNEIKYLLKVATAGSKEARQLEKVKKTFEEVYRQNVASEATNTKYSFVGIENIKKTLKNKNIDENQKQFLNKILDNYNNALSKGKMLSNEEIRKETGWFKDKKGDWKFEITDKYSKMKIKPKPNTEYKLGDILEHKLLFDIDPSLKNLKVVFADKKSGRGNYANIPLVRRIIVNNKIINEGKESIKSTLLHEAQHHNQYLNKFEQGVSSGKTLKDVVDYVNNLGEIEARTVQERMNLSQNELRNEAPEISKKKPQHPLKNELINKRKQEIANSSNNRYNNKKKGWRLFEEEGVQVLQESENENSNSNIRNGLKELDNSSFFDTKYSLSDKQKPSYMWHGTTKENLDSIKNNGFREDRRGYFATNHDVVKSNYGEDVIMLEQNDFNLKDITNEVMEFGMPTDAMREQAKAEGYDGVKYQTSKNNEDVEVFNIKKLNEVFDKTELENFELSQALGYDLTPEEQQRYDKLKNKNTKYSLSGTDNQGRTLTKEQQEYFKDSKVRDSEGRLLKVYHGTRADFNIFDISKSGSNYGGWLNSGKGHYFTDSEVEAKNYGKDSLGKDDYKVKEVYLNITNPFDTSQDYSIELIDMAKEYNIESDEMTDGVNLLNWFNANKIDSTEVLQKYGYDGIVDYGHYVAFNSNQIKNVDNTNPTSDADIRYSLGEDTAPKQSNLTYGEDVKLAISPLQEEISKVVDEVQQMREQIDKMVAPMPEYRNNTYEDLEALEQQYNENFENIDAENVPEGIDDNSNFFLSDEIDMVESEKQIKDVIRNTLGLNTKQTSDVYKSIVAIEDFDIDDVKNAIEEYSQFITSDVDTNLQDLKKALRTTKLDISYLKATDANFKDYVKNAFGSMRLANSGQAIDSFYNEMSSMYPDLLPSNIDNEADQFQRLLEVSKMDHVTKYTEAIPEEAMNEYANEIYKTIKNYQDNLAIQSSNKDFFNAVRKGEIIAPVEIQEEVETTPLSGKEVKVSPTRSEIDWDSVEDTSRGKQATYNDETQTIEEEDLVKKTKRELRRSLLGTEIQREFFTSALDNAKNRSMALMNNTDTIRNTELVFGRDAANVINEKIFQKEIDNEANSIKWQNEQRKEIKDLGIKARSKESAAVQKYGEKQYVNDVGEIIPYGDAELAREFSDVETQNKIKNAAKELRSKYDTYIDLANGVLTKLGFDPIPKRNDYMRHFQELNDVFSRYGIPFNAQNMAEHTLPTDINGLTEFWSPQKNYFANMQARKGVKTTYDAITGIDGYISGISNLIFHTEDIQRGRAFEELIRETYGEDKGWDNLENLPNELKQARSEKIQDDHLSNYAAWVHEWTNNVAGKKNKIDRSFEAFFGRKIFSVLDTTRKQVGSNMIGLNLSSSLTNLIAPVQATAKTNKLAVAKGTADTIKNIFIKDNFIEKNNFLTSRMGTDMISKNAWQKMQDAGFIFMKGMDWFSSNQIVRSKYYELRSKGMSEQQAHAEAGKFAARILGDRTKGANAQLYNSKLAGLVTQFQLEVNNQLYSQFYDTYHESKENAQGNALKTAAGMTFTLGQLFAFTHLFGQTFEAIAGYNPTFDVIEILKTALGWGDDDDEEKTTSERLKEAADQLVDALPYVNILTGGGRIPVASGIPNLVGVATGGKDEYGNELTWEDELKKLLFLVPPTGGNQVKKTYQGLSMFEDDLPVSGSYTDSGNLRFPVEDTPLNKLQAAMFGQWANKNAGEYFDNKRQPLKEKQIQEYTDLKLPIADYWEYRDGLKEQNTIKDKFEYINGLDVTDEQKNIMINNAVDRKEYIDMSNYDDFGSYEEFDFAIKNEEKYNFFQKNNISYDDYVANDESKEAYNWAYNNPDKYVIAKTITEDIVMYRKYTKELGDITADKDSNGKTISGSRKQKVFDYVNSLNLDFEQKVMLAKLEYPSYNEYNYEIVDYLNNRNDINYQEMVSILNELGMKVDANGNVSWE